MNRRRFLLSAVGVVATSGLAVPLLAERYPTTLQPLQAELMQWQLRLEQGAVLQSQGRWNPSEILQHLTQSVRGSYLGYPQHKAAWFRHSIGPAALSVFKALGKMQHPLADPIPGMPALDANQSTLLSLQQLQQALKDFQRAADLQPHFAYGELNHADFAAAHQLHIRAHLAELSLQMA